MATLSPDASSSCAAVAVTVCGVSQVEVENVSVRVRGVASPSTDTARSPLSIDTRTACVGSVARRTVYCFALSACPGCSFSASGPASRPGVSGSASIRRPGASSSSTVTCTLGRSDASSPVYADAPDAACVSVALSSDALSSSAALTVTVWAVSQLAVSNVSVRWSPLARSPSVSAVTAAVVPSTVTVTLPPGSVFSRTV